MEYCFFRKLTPVVKMNKNGEIISVAIPSFLTVKKNASGVLISYVGM